MIVISKDPATDRSAVKRHRRAWHVFAALEFSSSRRRERIGPGPGGVVRVTGPEQARGVLLGRTMWTRHRTIALAYMAMLDASKPSVLTWSDEKISAVERWIEPSSWSWAAVSQLRIDIVYHCPLPGQMTSKVEVSASSPGVPLVSNMVRVWGEDVPGAGKELARVVLAEIEEHVLAWAPRAEKAQIAKVGQTSAEDEPTALGICPMCQTPVTREQLPELDAAKRGLAVADALVGKGKQ